MSAAAATRTALRQIMQRGAHIPLPDAEFNQLALSAFRHQFDHNVPYRHYCERRARTPDSLDHWTDVPAVPTAAFKEVDLVAGNPAKADLVFKTSGTTRGVERRGTHFILDAMLYEHSLLASFRKFVLPDRARIRMLALAPSSMEAPASSLSYMIDFVMARCGTAASATYASAEQGIDFEILTNALADNTEPVCLLGTSLAYVHWLESLADRRLALPDGSRLMDTGGFKGAHRMITPEDLRTRYRAQLGIHAGHCVNEYGMTELCSQYYDAALGTNDMSRERVKQGPPWLRARIVHPDTLQPVAHGQTGILQHFDLANFDSVSAVLTEDFAYEAAGGFVLLGRAPGAMPRGCSIAMDMLLTDKHTS